MRHAVVDDLADITRLADRGELVAARGALEALLTTRVSRPGGHLECADLALELGLLKVAERELQLELRDLRDAPDHADSHARTQRAIAALAEVHDALGHADRAHGLRVATARDRGEPLPAPRALDPLGQAAPPAPAPAPPPPRRLAPDGLPPAAHGDLVRFLHLFSGRDDVHARQWLDARGRAGYSPIERPLTVELLESHLAGAQTLGVYQTRVDGTVCFFALDLDAIKPALERARRDRDEARSLRRAIAQTGLTMLREARRFGLELVLEDSGYKGRHLWGFLAEPLPTGLVRRLVKALARAVGPSDPRLSIECFPKQDRLAPDQIGNLIKLPLAIHLKTGRRAHILGPNGAPADDPWAILRDARRLTREEVLDALARLRDTAMLSGEPGAAALAEGVRAPAPLPAEADFTEADFETDLEVRAMLSRCAVLGALVTRGLERRRLVHEEQVVLRHTLGHFPVGTRAVNYVFSRCPEIGGDMFLKSVLKGNPMSCPKIRKRIPEVTARVPCHCAFKVRTDHYPTPLLHLDEARARGELDPKAQAPRGDGGGDAAPGGASAGGARDGEATGGASGAAPVPEAAGALIEDLARRYWHLRERVERLGRELGACEEALIRALSARPGERLEDAEGVLWLERAAGGEGSPQVRWRPASAAEASAPSPDAPSPDAPAPSASGDGG